MIQYIIVIIALFLIVILLLFLNYTKKENDVFIESTPEIKSKPCPICGWPLIKNEKVHSIVYRAETDSIMHIYGCPYCYKEHPKSKFNNQTKRKCPSCHKELKISEYAIARLFEKPGKNHVHVLGCYRCRGKR